jgi:hypothetical protein
MSRWFLLAIVLGVPAMLVAQGGNGPYHQPSAAPYQPAVPPPSVNAYGGNGGWGGWGGGATTAAGSALNGMAGVISAAGQRNLYNSAAAVNWTQVEKNQIENRQQATNTYFAMRETNRAATAAERAPRPTMEQLARYAKEGEPKPLNSSQVDPINGGLKWPSALQQPDFKAQRDVVDDLMGQRARYGVLDYADQAKVRDAIDTLYVGLKAQIEQIPAMDYVASRNFLRSINYAATKTEM